MKKVLLSLLFVVMICFTAAPALNAEAAEEMNGSFQLNVEEPVIAATAAEAKVMPEAEYNTDYLNIGTTAVTVGEKTMVYAEFLDIDLSDSVIAYIFDESGALLATGRYTRYTDGNHVLCFELEAFTESKQFMIALYTYKNTTREYTPLSAKKGNVTPVIWEGSMSLSKISAYTHFNSNYVEVYLPGTIAMSDVQVKMYDGDTQIGYMEFTGTYTTSNIHYPSLVTNLKSVPYYYMQGQTSTVIYGNVYWGRKLNIGESYTMKAFVGDQVYNLGSAVCREEHAVNAYCDTRIATDKPVVYVYALGYDFNDVSVQIVDSETGVVLATDESTEHNLYKLSSDSAIYVLESEKSIDELEGDRIVVKHEGTTVYKGYFSAGRGVVSSYYDHVQNVVIVRTYGIEDGTILKATINGGYEAQGVVVSNTVSLTFSKDGVATKLPIGSWTVNYSYAMNEDNYTDNVYNMEVMGKTESSNTSATVNMLMNGYFFSGQDMTVDVLVSKDRLDALAGDFTLNYVVAGETKQVPMTATVQTYRNVECLLLSGVIPSQEPGNYVVTLKRGETVVSNYGIGVLDREKVYGTLTTVSDSDGNKGVRVRFNFNYEGWDKSLVSLRMSDILGNVITDIGYTTTIYSNYVMFYFQNVPEDWTQIKVEPLYNGQPMYNINDILGKTLSVSTKPQPDEYLLYSTSMTNAQNYSLRIAFRPLKPSTAYVVEHGTGKLLKRWTFTDVSTYTYLTEEMLSGLNYDTAEVKYDIYFESTDGKNGIALRGLYFGLRKEPIIVHDGIGMDYKGDYWLYSNGEINYGYTGLYYWADRAQWVMIVGGLLDTSYTGLTLYNNIWWYVERGYVNFGYTGLADLEGTLWYVCAGQIDFSYNGLLCFNDDWYYLVNGAVDKSYNGLAFVNNDWWYVVNGMIDFGYTGLAYVNDAWWYVNQGKIDFTYTGLVFFGEDWWYVENGCLNSSYNGLAFVNESWWYVVAGRIDFDFSGLFLYNGDYWFVSQGKIILGYTGLVFYADQWWYLENGVVNFNYNGFAFVNEIWWWVEGGKIDFAHTGIHQFNGIWWYVTGAQIDFTYNGTVAGPDGNTYQVVNGEVQGYTGA